MKKILCLTLFALSSLSFAGINDFVSYRFQYLKGNECRAYANASTSSDGKIQDVVVRLVVGNESMVVTGQIKSLNNDMIILGSSKIVRNASHHVTINENARIEKYSDNSYSIRIQRSVREAHDPDALEEKSLSCSGLKQERIYTRNESRPTPD